MYSKVFLTDVTDQRLWTSCSNAVFCLLNGNANLPVDRLLVCQVYIRGIKECLHLNGLLLMHSHCMKRVKPVSIKTRPEAAAKLAAL